MSEEMVSQNEYTGGSGDRIGAGTVVGAKYRLDAQLGSGGMGTVWSCTHVDLGERMAIKIVSASAHQNAEVRMRFLREARATAKLKSRFTVRVFDTGELPNGSPYIVMEFLEGETLSEHLRRLKRLSLSETIRILGQVARGLEHAHRAGIVHRDIKPENIFLANTPDDGVVAKVFDFGIVKLLERTDIATTHETVEGTFLGTPQFMSPEQALGEVDVDQRADIYSLGVLAYRMLTGQRLFDAKSLPELFNQKCNGQLPKLRDRLPDLPAMVEPWFQRTCALQRDARYGSAMECIEALYAAAGASGSLAPPEITPLSMPSIPVWPTGTRTGRTTAGVATSTAPTAVPNSPAPRRRLAWLGTVLAVAAATAAIGAWVRGATTPPVQGSAAHPPATSSVSVERSDPPENTTGAASAPTAEPSTSASSVARAAATSRSPATLSNPAPRARAASPTPQARQDASPSPPPPPTAVPAPRSNPGAITDVGY
jgi:serine/threonine protein kinase